MGGSVRLVGDIGGTNARFALVPADSRVPRDEQVLHCADFQALEEAIGRYLADHGNPTIREAALDVATGITSDYIHLTNGPWGFSVEQTRRNLRLDRLLVINDFTALALGVPALKADELQQVGGGTAVPRTAIAVLGPGTGLGVSGLIPSGDGWIALQGEGGHTAFSPMSEREVGVLLWLQQRFDHVSTERVMSGMGLENLYRALCSLDGVEARPLGPDKITAAAMVDSDAHCSEAVAIFWERPPPIWW
jgi:glucokinase